MTRKSRLLLAGAATLLLLSAAAGTAFWFGWLGVVHAPKNVTALKQPANDGKIPHADPTLKQSIRDIIALQSDVAHGRQQAFPQLKEAMLRMSALVKRFSPEKPARQDLEMVALYILSGGNPGDVSTAIIERAPSDQDKQLLRGVIAYAQGDTVKAAEAVASIDKHGFEPLLEAQLLMTNAQLSDAGDKSIAMLAKAANLAPGTLIEEAAMRRILSHLAKRTDANVLLSWSTRYARRFPQSLYLKDFDKSFGRAARAVSWSEVSSAEFSPVLTLATKPVQSKMLQSILLSMVSQANLEACHTLSKTMATHLSGLDAEKSSIEALLALCEAGSFAPEKQTVLQDLLASDLPSDIAALVRDAAEMAKQVREPVAILETRYNGPMQPLSSDNQFSGLVASVTQQIDASVQAISKAK